MLYDMLIILGLALLPLYIKCTVLGVQVPDYWSTIFVILEYKTTINSTHSTTGKPSPGLPVEIAVLPGTVQLYQYLCGYNCTPLYILL